MVDKLLQKRSCRIRSSHSVVSAENISTTASLIALANYKTNQNETKIAYTNRAVTNRLMERINGRTYRHCETSHYVFDHQQTSWRTSERTNERERERTLALHILCCTKIYLIKDLYANGERKKFNVKSFTCDFVVAISTQCICVTSVSLSNRQSATEYKANSSDTRNSKQSSRKLAVKYLYTHWQCLMGHTILCFSLYCDPT